MSVQTSEDAWDTGTKKAMIILLIGVPAAFLWAYSHDEGSFSDYSSTYYAMFFGSAAALIFGPWLLSVFISSIYYICTSKKLSSHIWCYIYGISFGFLISSNVFMSIRRIIDS